MFYALYQDSELVAVVTESPFTGTPVLKEFPGITYNRAEDRWDFTAEGAEVIANFLTRQTGDVHLMVDNGEHCAPRFDVIRAPKIGDKVSYGFNGDYYPDGEIISVTSKFQVKTSGGHTYRRRKNSGSWLQPGGTWGLTQGHIDERNPHF